MTIYELFECLSKECEKTNFLDLKRKVTNEQYDQIDDRESLELVINVMSMYIDYDDEKASFGPSYVLRDGRRSFSIEDISEKDITLLRQLDVSMLPLFVKARICDVLWCVDKDYKKAQIASDAYFELFQKKYDPENWVECIEMLNRAVFLSAQINNTKKINGYLSYAYKLIIGLNGRDKLFFTTQVIRLFIKQKYKCDYEDLLPITDNLISGNKENDLRLKEAYSLKAEIYKVLGMKEDAKNVMLIYANELIEIAADISNRTVQDVAFAERYIKDAIIILRSYGQDTTEANKMLIAVQKKLVKGLSMHKNSLDNSETIEKIKQRYSVSYKECLLLLATDVPWMEKDKIKKEVIEDAKKYILSNMFIKTNINKNGNTVAIIPRIDVNNPEKDEAALLSNMYDKAKKEEEIITQILLLQILDILKGKEGFSEESLDFIVRDNILIPEGRENIFKIGLYKGINGQYYEALHILVPQVENLFRKLSEVCGDAVIVSKEQGIQEAITLGTVFDRKNLNLCYDENILFTFRGLMDKKEGANIRNLIGHGLMDANEVGYTGVFFICAVFKLLFYNSKNVYKEYSKNE